MFRVFGRLIRLFARSGFHQSACINSFIVTEPLDLFNGFLNTEKRRNGETEKQRNGETEKHGEARPPAAGRDGRGEMWISGDLPSDLQNYQEVQISAHWYADVQRFTEVFTDVHILKCSLEDIYRNIRLEYSD